LDGPSINIFLIYIERKKFLSTKRLLVFLSDLLAVFYSMIYRKRSQYLLVSLSLIFQDKTKKRELKPRLLFCFNS